MGGPAMSRAFLIYEENEGMDKLEFSLRLSDFGDDNPEGIKFFRDNFDKLTEDSKDYIFEQLFSNLEQLPSELRKAAVWAGFRCNAGRARLQESSKMIGEGLPKGSALRKAFLGDERGGVREGRPAPANAKTDSDDLIEQIKKPIREVVIMLLENKVSKDEIDELVKTAYDEGVQAYLDRNIGRAFEDGLAKMSAARQKESADRSQFLEAARRFEAEETETDPEKRKRKFLEFVRKSGYHG